LVSPTSLHGTARADDAESVSSTSGQHERYRAPRGVSRGPEPRCSGSAVRPELEQARDALRGELTRAQRSGQSLPSDRMTDAVRAAFCAREPTLEQALLVLGWLMPERVRVLPTALTSARRSSEFVKQEKAWDLLWRLATDYWEAMGQGRGDAGARHVFTPNEYSAQESETTKSNRVGRERRTFGVDGEPVTMWRHLKIGVKQDSYTETWRCHFEWSAKDRTIVIGHCGAHLDVE
jgi:hypothetical protein